MGNARSDMRSAAGTDQKNIMRKQKKVNRSTVKDSRNTAQHLKDLRKRGMKKIEIKNKSDVDYSLITPSKKPQEGSRMSLTPTSQTTEKTANSPESVNRTMVSSSFDEADDSIFIDMTALSQESEIKAPIRNVRSGEEKPSPSTGSTYSHHRGNDTDQADACGHNDFHNLQPFEKMQLGFEALQQQWKESSMRNLSSTETAFLPETPITLITSQDIPWDDAVASSAVSDNIHEEVENVDSEVDSLGSIDSNAMHKEFDQMMLELDQADDKEEGDDKNEDENDDDGGSIESSSLLSQSDGSDYESLGPCSASNNSRGQSVGDVSLAQSTISLIRSRGYSFGELSVTSSTRSVVRRKTIEVTMPSSLSGQNSEKPTASNAFETLPRHLISNSLLRQASSTLRDERFLTRRITKLGAVHASRVHVSDFVCMDYKINTDSERIEKERNCLVAPIPTAASFADGENVDSVTIDSFELFEKCIMELCGIQMVEFDEMNAGDDREYHTLKINESVITTSQSNDVISDTGTSQIKPKIPLADGGRALYSLGKYCQNSEWNDDAMEFYKHALYLFFLDLGVEEPRLLDNSDDCDGLFYVQSAHDCVLESSQTHQYLAEIFTKMGDIHGTCEEKNDALRAYRASEVFWRRYISDLDDENDDNGIKLLGAVEALALSFNRVGGVYTAKGELDAALRAFHEALQIQIETLGGGHIEVAKTLHNIGVCHRHSDDLEAALEYYTKAHQIFEKNLGRDHLDSVRTLHNIGGVYRRQREYTKAMDCFKEVLIVRRNLLGDNHASVSITLVSMAAVLRRCGKIEEANQFYSAAVH